jgi:serine-type D-Ala-D-Ala carboxypeptidase (penicillin-binding protein 5/6)
MMEASMELQSPLFAPLAPEDAVGRVRVSLDGPHARRPHPASAGELAGGGFLRRAMHSVLLWFE